MTDNSDQQRVRVRRRAGALVMVAGVGVVALAVPAWAQEAPPNICAEVFDDLNGNAVHDAGEPGLDDVWVNLRRGTEPWTIITGGLTDPDGRVCFVTNPDGGPYKLEENDPDGYESVTPNLLYPIDVTFGAVAVREFADRRIVATPPEEETTTTAAPTTVAPTTVAPTTEEPAPTTGAAAAVPVSPTTSVSSTTSAFTAPTVAPSTPTAPAPIADAAAADESPATLPRTGMEGGLAIVGAAMVVVGGLLSAVRRYSAYIASI